MSAKTLLSAILCFVLAFSVQLVAAQDKTITGKVTDSKDGSPVAGASVQAKGSKTGTTTRADGTFSLSVGSDVSSLVFSSVGYETQEVSVAGKTSVEVSFAPSAAANLNEVVVTGYGTARRKDLTGSISSVKAKDFNKGVQVSPDQLIQGKVAGVQVTNNSGQPGGGTTIRIRGNSSIRTGNTPLFVIDGVPLSNTNSRPDIGLTNAGGGSPAGNPFNFINPADIASIDILKDASAAAIYGSRGANGVVLITTKRGQSGAPRVEVSSSFGVSNILKKLEVLTADEYRKALTDNGFNTTVNTTNGPNFGSSADAWEAISRTGNIQNYNVSIGAGNENAKYRLSFGYLDQTGIIRKTDFKKYTAGINTTFKFLESKKLGLDFNVLSSHTAESVAPISNSAGFQGSLIGQALIWNPTRPIRNAAGAPIVDYTTDAVINPLAYSEAYFDNPKVTTILANIAPSYKITNELEYKMQLSLNYSVGSRKQYTTGNINFNDLKNQFSTAFNDTIGGEANVAQNELLTSQITNTLSYVKNLSSAVSLNAVVGHEYQVIKFSGNSQYARGFLRSDKPNYYYMSNSDPQTRRIFGFADPKQELQSFFGRVVLNFSDKYLVTATMRADGSSKFGENNKYGYFPSIAAAWNISKEAFMANFNAVKNIKLRAGFGITGNQEFPAGASQQIYTLTGGDPRQNYNRTQLENPDLQWEETESVNIGLDFTILNNRISGSLDYFNRNTSKILFPVDAAAPGPTGSVQWKNLPGNIINSGFEIALNGNIAKNKDWNFDLGLNLSFLKNELKNSGLFLNTGEINGQGLSGAFSQLTADNQPLNVFYLKRFLGIDKTTGVSIYEEGDKKFFVGSPNPKMLIGISPSVSYKKFSLEINMNGAFGHYVYNNTTNAALSFNNLGKRNLSKKEYEYGISNGEKPVNPTSASSRYLEKGDFLKMANTTLSYNLGNIGKSIRNMNVYVTAQNLFVITNYSGFDPEVNTAKPLNGIPSFGIEYTPYPSARTINFGLTFSL
jgi:TonB-dependent starch-binding outer membrane protein SusC